MKRVHALLLAVLAPAVRAAIPVPTQEDLRRSELSVGVQDLTDPRHPEFGDELFTNATEVERNVVFQLRW